MADRDDLTEFGQWEYDRAIIATSNDLKYISWQFDKLKKTADDICYELKVLRAYVGLGVLALWIGLGALSGSSSASSIAGASSHRP